MLEVPANRLGGLSLPGKSVMLIDRPEFTVDVTQQHNNSKSFDKKHVLSGSEAKHHSGLIGWLFEV